MSSSEANYGGRMPNDTAYIKRFIYGSKVVLWKTSHYKKTSNPDSYDGVLAPAQLEYSNVHIPGNLYVDGSILNPSDERLKSDIDAISAEQSAKVLQLNPVSYVYRSDNSKQVHYGLLAQDVQEVYPHLVQEMPLREGEGELLPYHCINYVELVPLLLKQMQVMQQEIDELKETMSLNP